MVGGGGGVGVWVIHVSESLLVQAADGGGDDGVLERHVGHTTGPLAWEGHGRVTVYGT